MWTGEFLNPERKSCSFNNIWICATGVQEITLTNPKGPPESNEPTNQNSKEIPLADITMGKCMQASCTWLTTGFTSNWIKWQEYVSNNHMT